MRKETEILPEDEINIMFAKAIENGWSKWGKFYRKKGSSYQCFRRGKEYLWIGFAFIERVDYSVVHYTSRFKRKETDELINKILS